MTATLRERERALVQLSACLASAGAAADSPQLQEAMEEAVAAAETEAVEEAILQSYLFLGYPAALNAFRLWRAVSGTQGGGGPEGPEEGWEVWARRGEAVCRKVYGGQYEDLRGNVRKLHPDMEQWMVTEGYGKVLGRSGLDLPTRELCIAAILVVVRAPAQLYSHLRGALHVGASPRAVEEMLSLVMGTAGPEAAEVARETWARVRRRAPDGGGS